MNLNDVLENKICPLEFVLISKEFMLHNCAFNSLHYRSQQSLVDPIFAVFLGEGHDTTHETILGYQIRPSR